MTKYLSTQDFLANLVSAGHDFDCPGMGMVQLRGLTLAEVHGLRTKYMTPGKEDIQSMQIQSILLALVQPKLSEAHVQALADGSASVTIAISDEIVRLSGMDDDTKNGRGGGS